MSMSKESSRSSKKRKTEMLTAENLAGLTSVSSFEEIPTPQPSSSRAAQVFAAPESLSSVPNYEIPTILGNLFALVMNAHDVQAVEDYFHRFCTVDCRVSLHFYSLAKMGMKQKNLLGKFKELTFPDVMSFLCFLENFFIMTPDVTMIVSNHRRCLGGTEDNHELYMSMFEWTGTALTRITELLQESQGKIQVLEMQNECSGSAKGTEDLMVIQLRGSIGFIVDSHSRTISAIDLFYECIQDP